ncbi:MAG: response regulator transcription factor [Eubacteriales bacterium]|nr:response regulator transcription factor [Eubacteriales bacterium]
MTKIRILTAEDDPDYRLLIQATLSMQPDMDLCALCANGSDALEAARQCHPDIVLMDLNLDTLQLDGIGIARSIRLCTDAKVIILTALEAPETVVNACRRAFASGYVLKSQAALLIPTIRATAAGITPQAILIYASLLQLLTPAEQTVFFKMMGLPANLRSASKTIANQQTSILRKLDIDSKEDMMHLLRVYLDTSQKT